MKIRLEQPEDRREAEELTRDAFWNKYRPGCTEHYILHRYRDLPDFVRELCYVVEIDGRLVAHIMYSRASILADSGARIPILIFGPVSVLPEKQGMGYGGALIQHTLSLAAHMGFGAVAITGDPGYYHRFGFVRGSEFGIRYGGVPDGADAPFFLIKELQKGFLQGGTGVFHDPDGYVTDDAEVDSFDASFPPREKLVLPGQLV